MIDSPGSVTYSSATAIGALLGTTAWGEGAVAVAALPDFLLFPELPDPELSEPDFPEPDGSSSVSSIVRSLSSGVTTIDTRFVHNWQPVLAQPNVVTQCAQFWHGIL